MNRGGYKKLRTKRSLPSSLPKPNWASDAEEVNFMRAQFAPEDAPKITVDDTFLALP
jgi:hypothetical protein